MKILVTFGILMLALTSCTSLPSQEMQQERQAAIETHEDTRLKHKPEKIKSAIKAQLVGKWQLIDIEVEKGNDNAQLLKSIKGILRNLPPPDASSQPPGAPDPSLHPDANAQTPEANSVRLSPIEAKEHEDNQKIAAAKAALLASTRKNLTIEFFEDRTSYYYSGSNRGMNVTGQCSISTSRFGDKPIPLIRFNRRTGQEMLEFLFGAEHAKRMIAKKKQADAERRRKMGAQIGRRASAKAASYPITSAMGITFTDNRLHLILYGDMELTPKGWRRTGGLRCSFEHIE